MQHPPIQRSPFRDRCFPDWAESAFDRLDDGRIMFDPGALDFPRFADLVARMDRGSALTEEERSLLEHQAHHIDAARSYTEMRNEDRERIRKDIRRHGDRAVSFYAAVRRDDLTASELRRASALHTARSTRPRARRRGAGRPRAQAARSSSRSGDSPDSDSNSDGESPSAASSREDVAR